MQGRNTFIVLFIIVSLVLIAYGFYVDIRGRIHLTFVDALELAISLSSSVLGIIFVVYEVQERKFMFVISIIASSLMIIYLLCWSPLIWDFMLSIGYLAISVYALYYWNRTGDKHIMDERHAVQTRILSIKGWIVLGIIAILGTSLLSMIGMRIGKYTSSIQAISDAFTTVVSIIGQVLLSRKYLESWYMWIVTNTVSIPLYISIGSYTYGMLFLCYLLISFYGLYTWKRTMKEIMS